MSTCKKRYIPTLLSAVAAGRELDQGFYFCSSCKCWHLTTNTDWEKAIKKLLRSPQLRKDRELRRSVKRLYAEVPGKALELDRVK